MTGVEDTGKGPEDQGERLRVTITDEIGIEMADTESNRKALMVVLRSLRGRDGKALLTYQEISEEFGYADRQNAENMCRAYGECGEDLLGYLRRKRKVDEEVVDAVLVALREDLWVSLSGLADRVNTRLGREDLTSGNMSVALDQVSGRVVRGLYLRKVACGAAHFKESYVVDRLFGMVLSGSASEESGGRDIDAGVVSSLEVGVSPRGGDGQAALGDIGDRVESMKEQLLEVQEESVSEGQVLGLWEGKVGWMVWSFVLYMQGVSLSVIGGWLGVHKSTICRWLSVVGDMGWAGFQGCRVAFSGRASVDEKWVKIGGVWWYLFAAVDCVSGYPLHVALYPSNSGAYCKLFLLELRRLGYRPRVIVTDGWDGYIQAIASVFPQAEHLLCRFHLLRSVFRRLRNAGVWEEEVWALVGKLFHTGDKRTVRRRVEKLCGMVRAQGVAHVVSGLVGKLPQVIGAVGSTWRPSTSNAAEGFFRALDRFYRLKGPFCDEASAQKHIRLFVLWHIFSVGASGQACPLEKAGESVGKIPLYHLINRPNVLMLRKQMATPYRIAA